MNIPEVTIGVWFPVISLLVMIPLLCWCDWKYREIPDYTFGIIAVINLPFLAYQYISGAFGWEEAIVSILPCIIYYAIMRSHKLGDFFHGDDMLFLWCISLFCVINPLHPNAGALPVTVMIYLIPVMISFYFGIFIKNVLRDMSRVVKGDIISLNEVMNREIIASGRNFPLVIPISVAFILAVIL